MSAMQDLMPPQKTAKVNGVELAYYEVGPREGVPVVFCHGFPELAFSWRHQLQAFEAAGRWAIAVDQRGYGGSSRPEAVADYDIDHLTGDLAALLDHLGIQKAIFCGHDWGGIVVWQMPLWRPDKVAGVIGVNTPFMPRAPADPIAIMRARFGEQMYIVHFQKPGEADAVLSANARKAMDFFMRRPAKDAAPVASGIGGGEDEQNTFPLIEILKLYDPAFDEREFFLTDEEFEAFVETFERTGFTGGINWYRNFTRNWEISADKPTRIEGVPCLMVMAEKDAVLPPAAADGMEAYVADLEKVLVKDSGHWTQQEQPEAVNRILLDWLDRRFPK